MTSVERAKVFLAKRASKLALGIVPLALAAVPAFGGAVGTTLSAGSPLCTFGTNNSSSSNNSCSAQGLPDSPAINPLLNALSVYGTDTVTNLSSGSGGAFGLTLTFGGPASGSFNGNVPVNFIFTISETNSSDPLTWSLKYDIGAFSTSFNGTGAGTKTGSGSITGPVAVTLVSPATWDAILTVTASSGQVGDKITVNIPQGATINLNQSTTTTPEPGSMLGMGSGLAALFAFFRWRKNRS